MSSEASQLPSAVNYEHIKVATEDDFAVVTMCRAKSRNSLSEDHLLELTSAFEAIARSDARGVVIAAEGPVFSSGHDFKDMVDRDLGEMTQLLEVCGEFMQLIMRMPQPVIAQIEGIATAAGCQLVASCDLAVAGESTQFQTPGGRGGWFCHTPGVALARAGGRKRALEMLVTGDPIDAQTALAWGLVNRVVPDADVAAETRALLRRATAGTRAAKAKGKEIFYRQVDRDVSSAYEVATEAMAETSQWPDAQERIKAFIEKRAPRYKEPDET